MKAYFIVFVSLYTLSGNNNNTSFTPSRLSLGCPQPTLDTQKLDIQYVQIRITEYCHTSMHSVWYPKIEHIHRENIIKNGGGSHWVFFSFKMAALTPWRQGPSRTKRFNCFGVHSGFRKIFRKIMVQSP